MRGKPTGPRPSTSNPGSTAGKLPLAQNEARVPKVTVTIAGTSTDYLDTAHVLDTTMKNWDPSALRAESSDELLAAVPDEKLAQLLQTFSARLGPIKSHGAPRGESRLNLVPFRRVVTAEYVVPTTFEKAEGQVALRFILKGDQWKLLAVNVNSEALLR